MGIRFGIGLARLGPEGFRGGLVVDVYCLVGLGFIESRIWVLC